MLNTKGVLITGRLELLPTFINGGGGGELINGRLENSSTNKSFTCIHLKVVYENYKIFDITKFTSAFELFNLYNSHEELDIE